MRGVTEPKKIDIMVDTFFKERKKMRKKTENRGKKEEARGERKKEKKKKERKKTSTRETIQHRGPRVIDCRRQTTVEDISGHRPCLSHQ